MTEEELDQEAMGCHFWGGIWDEESHTCDYWLQMKTKEAQTTSGRGHSFASGFGVGAVSMAVVFGAYTLCQAQSKKVSISEPLL